MKKKIVFLIALFILAFSTTHLSGAVAERYENSTVNLVFRVTVHSMDRLPLENATVKILETGDVYVADKNGQTQFITLTLPIHPLGGQDWSAVTLVVKHKDYITTVLYNCIVYPKRIRYGPTIHMLIKDEGSPPYIALVEVPPDDWTTEIAK